MNKKLMFFALVSMVASPLAGAIARTVEIGNILAIKGDKGDTGATGPQGPTGQTGCTPDYSMKYINRSNGSTTYDNDEKDATTIGTRVTISGCGASPLAIDTYNGNNGTSFNYLGKKSSCSSLPTNNVQQNDAYLVDNDGLGLLYIYNGSTWNCPDGGVEFTGPQGDQGLGICDNVADTSTAVKNIVRSYVAHNENTRGYMQLQRSMCDNTTVQNDKIEDECVPVMPADAATCSNGTYLECTPQGGGDAYYICTATTGTTISSALSTMSGKVTTLETTVGNASSGLVHDVAQKAEQSALNTVSDKVTTLETTIGNASSGLVHDVAQKAEQSALNTVSDKVTTLETTIGNASSGLVQKTNNLETAVDNKLDKNVSFNVANGFIQMTAGETTVNVASVASLKGETGASAYEVWRDDQIANHGGTTSDTRLEDFYESLKPCSSYSLREDTTYDGAQGDGKMYELLCND